MYIITRLLSTLSVQIIMNMYINFYTIHYINMYTILYTTWT